jgi:hypothetical protein
VRNNHRPTGSIQAGEGGIAKGHQVGLRQVEGITTGNQAGLRRRREPEAIRQIKAGGGG